MASKSCPKCGFANEADLEVCLKCGVIFAKIPTMDSVVEPCEPAAEANARQTTLNELLFDTPTPTHPAVIWGRLLLLVVVSLYGGKLIFAGIQGNAAGESLLHLVNLPFHEAGHVLFRPFGSFMTSLGGTLLQLLVPLICLCYLLLKTRDPFGASVCLWWFGENFLDIAPYINDARAGQLPLLGGNFGHSSPYGFHDWNYLLNETGLLRYDHAIATLSHGLGSLLMLLAVGWGACLLLRQFRQ